MDNEFDAIRSALRRMPVPDPRPGFVDRALARATAAAPSAAAASGVGRGRWRSFAARGSAARLAAAGALAAAITVFALYPRWTDRVPMPQVGLELDEAREISVVIDAERDLPDATIRVYVTGGIELAGFEDRRELTWVATLENGSNLLALPVIARAPGNGRLVAEVEHEGRRKRISVDVRVSPDMKQRRSGLDRPLQDRTA